MILKNAQKLLPKLFWVPSVNVNLLILFYFIFLFFCFMEFQQMRPIIRCIYSEDKARNFTLPFPALFVMLFDIYYIYFLW